MSGLRAALVMVGRLLPAAPLGSTPLMATEIDLRSTGDERGRSAQSPTDIPPRGWRDVLARTAREAKQDQIVLLGAGVAFFGLLALVPALLATVGIYGLVADPADVGRHVTDLPGAAPGEVRDLAESQLSSITSEVSQSVSLGLALALAVALWSASSGVKHRMGAPHAFYAEVAGSGVLQVRR